MQLIVHGLVWECCLLPAPSMVSCVLLDFNILRSRILMFLERIPHHPRRHHGFNFPALDTFPLLNVEYLLCIRTHTHTRTYTHISFYRRFLPWRQKNIIICEAQFIDPDGSTRCAPSEGNLNGGVKTKLFFLACGGSGRCS